MKRILLIMLIFIIHSLSSTALAQSGTAIKGNLEEKTNRLESDGNIVAARQNKPLSYSSSDDKKASSTEKKSSLDSSQYKVNLPPISRRPPTNNGVALSELSLSGIYRVGIGDVLDIRLSGVPANRSTLYTVLERGLIEFPALNRSILVNGMTIDEISSQISMELRRPNDQNGPKVYASVREYASHKILITGLINNPGEKFLRSEVVPLYLILAEAQQKVEAGQATILRVNEQPATVDLNSSQIMSTYVKPGDVITVNERRSEYYFIGGRIVSSGQKFFHPGLTLIQAVLAAGGTLGTDNFKADISRADKLGRLSSTRYDIKKIKEGKIPDPVLQPGDRVEVLKAR
jgi:protein involved in polysaccharide export with SLBB domain